MSENSSNPSVRQTGNPTPASLAVWSAQQHTIEDGGTIEDAVEHAGYYSPLTNGDVVTPELVFSLGDVIMVWTPGPV